MGGGFDPFHFGHKNNLLTVRKKFDIDKIIIIPTFQTPLKEKNIDPAHRLEMLKRVFVGDKGVIIDDQEILRGGTSYSYKSCNQIVRQNKDSEIFLIIGLDQLKIFDRWKNFSKILEKANLIVTSRSGASFFNKISEFPKKMQKYLKRKYGQKIFLKNSTNCIYFCPLKDRDISSSLVRQKVREGKSIKHLVPSVVNSYVKENNLYKFLAEESKEENLENKISFCKEELEKRKAFNIQDFDLRDRNLPFSSVIIASCSNTIQTKSLANFLKKRMKEELGLKVLNEEGQLESRWIVLDYGDIIIHIFYDYTRKMYNLEDLWV